MSVATDPHVSWVLGHFNKVKSRPSKGGLGWMACCPAHEDRTPSLTINMGSEGILLKCFAGCPVASVCQAAGFEMKILFYHQWEKMNNTSTLKRPVRRERKVEKIYRYKDEKGQHIFDCFRWIPKEFTFRSYQPGKGGPEDGDWPWTLEGARLVVYHLDQIAGSDVSRPVYIVEGEKKADLLEKHGLVATCNPGGTGMGWRPDYSKQLAGRHCVILPDNDNAGQRHACLVAGMLMGQALSVRLVQLPGSGEKEDVADWMVKGNTIQDLLKLVATSTCYRRLG